MHLHRIRAILPYCRASSRAVVDFSLATGHWLGKGQNSQVARQERLIQQKATSLPSWRSLIGDPALARVGEYRTKEKKKIWILPTAFHTPSADWIADYVHGLRLIAVSREGSNVVDCGHSYCLVRSRSGGPLRGFGTGLPNGRTEFPIGRSAVRTTVGKVRTTIKKVRYPTGKVPGQIVPKSPSMQAESA